MQFDEDPIHSDIREGVRRVCRAYPDPYWRDHDQRQEFPWDFYEAMADGGWIGIAMPVAHGGGGQGITEAAIVLEEAAASGAAMNGCSALHTSMFGMNPVVKHGSPALRDRYLPEVATGRLHVAFGRNGARRRNRQPTPPPSPPRPGSTVTGTSSGAARCG